MPSTPKQLNIADYTYELPDERIARFPLAQRDQAKLLVYQHGTIGHTYFHQLPDQLPTGSLLVFNETRVIHARLTFTLPNGHPLEIFCLEPLEPAEYQQNFSAESEVRWQCLVGGNRRWKSGRIHKQIETPTGTITLQAERIGRLADAFEIAFRWDQPISFGELLSLGGIIPLPPYLQREARPEDQDRYQTVYARQEGSVAAPTAGLHFTDAVLAELQRRNMQSAFVTLHVGAGTFRPVRSQTIGEHHMHQESIYIDRLALSALRETLSAGRPVIGVGTTSTRLLESLYWHGAALLSGQQSGGELQVEQWTPYDRSDPLPPAAEALAAILKQLDREGRDMLTGQTRIIIAPGYTFRIIEGLITNFHQPNSTLLLLVAALVGDDWQRVYNYALANDFRFLSYGDSSLLWRRSNLSH